MSRATASLDHMALHERLRLTGEPCPRCKPRISRACPCGGACPRCRRAGARFSAESLENPSDNPGASFRQWRGWTPGPPIAQVVSGGRAVAAYQRAGPALYRIRSANGQVHYIGAVYRRSVATRLAEHLRPGDGKSLAEQQVHNAITNPRALFYIDIHPLRLDTPPRVTHMYEIWRQKVERPLDWGIIRDTTTFEREDASLAALF